MPKYFLQTKRLGLRLLKQEDIEHLIGLESDPEVQKYSQYGIKNREKTEAIINAFICDYEKNGLPCLLVFNLVSDEFMGRAGFIFLEGNVEVGYTLHKKFWGKGYATEVLTALLEWARINISTNNIFACVDINNKASVRVLEKCGMENYKNDMDNGVECRFYRIKNK
jgi:ribosomal-protein-alanine N-acetyltransferase